MIRVGLFLMNTRHLLYSDSEQDRIFRNFLKPVPIVVVEPGWPYPVRELQGRARSGLDVDEREARRMQSRALSDYLKLLQAMDVDLQNRTCKQILLADEHGREGARRRG